MSTLIFFLTYDKDKLFITANQHLLVLVCSIVLWLFHIFPVQLCPCHFGNEHINQQQQLQKLLKIETKPFNRQTLHLIRLSMSFYPTAKKMIIFLTFKAL